MRHLFLVVLLLAAREATADDRFSAGYVASRPVAVRAPGLAQAAAARWDHRVAPSLELGAGLEIGRSGGEEPLTRFALLPGVAFVYPYAAVTLRLEQQIGWQLAHGRLTLDGVPLTGTEPRGFHSETAVSIDAPISGTVSLGARAGMVIDGIYPAGHASTHVGPFVALTVAIAR